MTILVVLAPALDRVRAVLEEHKPVNRERWRVQSAADHVAHSVDYLMAWQAGEAAKRQLDHAACRLLFALTHDVADVR